MAEKKEEKPRKETELYVFLKAKALAEYIMRVSAGAPVKFRYSVLTPLIQKSQDVICLLYEANETPDTDPERRSLIRKAIAEVKCVAFIASFASMRGCFSAHQGEVIARYSGECLKYMQGYLKTCKA